jgi:pilus assembly protein CpaC
VNGEAKFLAGGEIPIPSCRRARGQPISIIFRSTASGSTSADGDRLGYINLRVVPRSCLTSRARSRCWIRDSGVLTRRVDTVVELKDGQSLVIGGLTNTEVKTIQRKIPLLGDIPVLGVIFRSSRREVTENELVILVSPRIIRPLEASEVPALPNPDEEVKTDQ